MLIWEHLISWRRTWSPLSRSKSVTQTIAARMPAWYVSAANIVDSISMFTTPKSCNLFKYSILSFSVNSQNAPSRRPWPTNNNHNFQIRLSCQRCDYSGSFLATVNMSSWRYLRKNRMCTSFFRKRYRTDQSLDPTNSSIHGPIFCPTWLVVRPICRVLPASM